MRELAIYGAGGLGREVAAMMKYYNYPEEKWNLIGFFDDTYELGAEISSFGTVIGGIKELNLWSKPLDIALAFGNPSIKHTIRDKITNDNISFPNLISPDFLVTDPESFTIGEGNIIQGHVEATTDVTIGNFNLFNGGDTIGHDVQIGDYNVIMPGVRISGKVRIGDGNLLGAMSFIREKIRIGNGVTLSPLSPLLTNPKDQNTYIGNPAKILKF